MRSLHLDWFFSELSLKQTVLLLRELFGKTPQASATFSLVILLFRRLDLIPQTGLGRYVSQQWLSWTTDDIAQDRWEHLATVVSSQLWIFSNSCGPFSHVPRFGDWDKLTPLNRTATHPSLTDAAQLMGGIWSCHPVQPKTFLLLLYTIWKSLERSKRACPSANSWD